MHAAASLLTIIAWGSAFTGVRIALRDYSPEHVALLRYAVASILFTIYALAVKMALPRLYDVPGLFGVGLIGIAAYNVALSYGQVATPAATASFIIASAPIWMALLAAIIFRERLRGATLAGIALSFVGVGVIAFGRGGLHADSRAIVLIGAAIAQSVYSLAQKKYVREYGPLACTAYAIWAGTLGMLPFASGAFDAVAHASAASTIALIFLGLVPSVLGYAAWSHVIARVPAAIAGTLLYVVPLAAMAIAWIVLGETPSSSSLAGGAAVIAGVAFAQSNFRLEPARAGTRDRARGSDNARAPTR